MVPTGEIARNRQDWTKREYQRLFTQISTQKTHVFRPKFYASQEKLPLQRYACYGHFPCLFRKDLATMGLLNMFILLTQIYSNSVVLLGLVIGI